MATSKTSHCVHGILSIPARGGVYLREEWDLHRRRMNSQWHKEDKKNDDNSFATISAKNTLSNTVGVLNYSLYP